MAFLKGLDNVLRALNKEIKEIENRSVIGMGKAVMMIRREMDEKPPLVPIGPDAGQVESLKKEGIYRQVGTGNLRASWFSYPFNLPIGPAVIFGFSANYAVFVHEMIGKNIRWSRPGAGPKFLQSAIRLNKDRILGIIRDEARIK